MDVCKDALNLFFASIAWEWLWLAKEVSLWDDRAWHGNIVDDGEEIIEGAQRRKPAVDRERRETLRDAVGNVCIYLMKSDSRWWFLCP